MKRIRLAAVLALTAAAVPAWGQVTVSQPWVRGIVEGQKATGAYMQVRSADGAVLVAARSPIAGVVEIHEARMENNMMRMRAVPKVDLPAGQTVELKPGGYHVMLMDLRQTPKAGDTVPITLSVVGRDGKTQEIEVKAEVRALGAAGGHPKH
ncbi:MAG: copper chaperone PCu(A)C [Burkholderiales bacterium]